MSQKPLIFAGLLFAGVALMGISPTQAKRAPIKPADQLDARTSLSDADKKHLLEDNFVLVKTVAAIPSLVQKKLLGQSIEAGMADAGQPYQFTDGLGSKPLPSRRLVFAGTSPGYCFVYDEYGGYAPGQEVSLYHLLRGKAILKWHADLQHADTQDDKKHFTLPELRSVVDKGKFYSLQLSK